MGNNARPFRARRAAVRVLIAIGISWYGTRCSCPIGRTVSFVSMRGSGWIAHASTPLPGTCGGPWRRKRPTGMRVGDLVRPWSICGPGTPPRDLEKPMTSRGSVRSSSPPETNPDVPRDGRQATLSTYSSRSTLGRMSRSAAGVCGDCRRRRGRYRRAARSASRTRCSPAWASVSGPMLAPPRRGPAQPLARSLSTLRAAAGARARPGPRPGAPAAGGCAAG